MSNELPKKPDEGFDKKAIDLFFEMGGKLDSGAARMWIKVSAAISNEERHDENNKIVFGAPHIIDPALLQPLFHYEDFLRSEVYTGDMGEYVLSKSDPEAMRAFNVVVDAYNADLPRIIRERDARAVTRYTERALAILAFTPIATEEETVFERNLDDHFKQEINDWFRYNKLDRFATEMCLQIENVLTANPLRPLEPISQEFKQAILALGPIETYEESLARTYRDHIKEKYVLHMSHSKQVEVYNRLMDAVSDAQQAPEISISHVLSISRIFQELKTIQ